MTKRNNMVLMAILAVIIIVLGGYLIFHKSPKPTSTAASSAQTKSSANTPSTTSGPIIQTKTSATKGSYLADSSGSALYNFTSDTSGVSKCSGSCIVAWPAYTPTTSSAPLPANLTIIARSDGTNQYAYKGLPLYTFTGDSNGQITGDGVSGFTLAKP